MTAQQANRIKVLERALAASTKTNDELAAKVTEQRRRIEELERANLGLQATVLGEPAP